MDKLKEAHDDLLAVMPEDETHDMANCLLCNEDIIPEKDSNERGEMETFTKDELDAAVKAAIAPIQAELDSVKEAQAKGEIAQEIADAQAVAAELVAAAQAELDLKVLEAQDAVQRYSDLVAFLEAQDAQAEADAQMAALKAERLEAIKELASFPEDHIEKNLDRWVAMDEETFAAQLETWSLLSATKNDSAEANVDSKIAETAMSAVRPEANGGSSIKSGIQAITGARAAGVSIRTF